MKLTFTSPDGSLRVEAEPKDIRSAFMACGQIQSLLMAEPCGCCKSKRTHPSSKEVGKGQEKKTIFQWVCADCEATLFIVVMDNGRMFPSRQDKNKNPLPNRGWSVYDPGHRNGQPQNHSQEPNREPQAYSQDESEVPF